MYSLDNLQRHLDEGGFDHQLSLIHSQKRLTESKNRLARLIRRMENSFSSKTAGIASSPGRTEMGGNHTDHNHGHVLAAAVNLDCLCVFSPSETTEVTILSENYDRSIVVDISETTPLDGEEGTSEAIVRGVADGFRKAGFIISGFNACVCSTIPAGAGLSSSAAFEVLVGRIFNYLFNENKISELDIARIAKRAENIHFAKPCGFMDQMACSFEGILSIDFNNPDSPGITRVEPGFEQNKDSDDFFGTGYRLCVVDTGGSHADLTPDYAAIPKEMFLAANCLGRNEARGLSVDDVLENIPSIREKIGERAILRLLHFIGENERAILQAKALQKGNINEFLKLVADSGHSSSHLLQNCYSNSEPTSQPIPLAIYLTELMLKENGVARIHGGGFAGTLQAYIHNSCFETYQKYMKNIFGPTSVIELSLRQPGNEFLTIETEAGI